MKLVTFAYQGETHIGALILKDGNDCVFDFNRARPGLPTDMTPFLRGDNVSWAMRALASADERFLVSLSDITLLAPAPHPGKIICIGHNYHDHAGATPPAYPDIFAKFANVLIGPNQPIVIPRETQAADYEAELAVVIGKRARRIAQANALDVVAGYTIFNDVTARDYQKRQSQWTIGKSFDTFGPLGPALVTHDEIGDPGKLDLSLWVNGEQRQHANTRDLIFSVPFLIAYLSQVITMEPGDIISTGTPSGTGASRNPPIFLQAGDEVRIRIEKIGELVNSIVTEES